MNIDQLYKGLDVEPNSLLHKQIDKYLYLEKADNYDFSGDNSSDFEEQN